MNNTFVITSGHRFEHPSAAQARAENTVPGIVFAAVLEAVNDLATKKATMLNDSDLSPQGRERRLKPQFESAWNALVAAHLRLAEFETELDSREAVLLAVPKLDPTHSACAVEDAECRAHFRSLSMGEQSAIVKAMQNDPEAGKRWERLQIAVIRTPVPMPSPIADLFLGLWKQSRRLDNPGEALAIDAARAALAWALRGLQHAQGILAAVSEWSRADLLAWLVADKARAAAAKPLGFSLWDVSVAQNAQQATQQKPILTV
jgi:hypothetical protein